MMQSHDLAIPVYLDTNALLDVLASIEGGFSMVEKVTTRSSQSQNTQLSGGTEFGIANVLNLLKIDLSASGTRAKGQEAAQERESVRYHTYGSLLNRLRLQLMDQRTGLLRRITCVEDWQVAAASDFVELRGAFTPNPLLAGLRSLNQMLGLFSSMGRRLDSTKGKSAQEKQAAQAQTQKVEAFKKVIEDMIGDLSHEGVQTYVVELLGLPGYRVLISIFSDYLRDRSGTELPYGEFLLFGKVTRKLTEGTSIDLLRGSSFSGLSDEMLSGLLGPLQQLGEQGFKLPDLVTRVQAPAMQVVPIAIYV